MKHSVALFFVAVLLVINGCTQKVDLNAEKSNVKSVVDQFIQALETENIELFAKIMAHDPDMVNFGTDAAERWVGWQELKESVEKQFASFDKTKLTVKDQVIKLNSSGNTAWFSEVVDWDVSVQDEPIHIEGSRITGVLEKQNGNWVCVQFHTSVPMSGQAVEY
jgi:uncharacterized protein (TIGR02246 family)